MSVSLSSQRRRRFQPSLEQFEERCVPSVSALASDAAALTPGVPTTVAKTVALAQKYTKNLNTVIANLNAANAHASGALTKAVLNQNLQVSSAELSAMNNLIRTLQTTNISPEDAFVKFFTLEIHFTKTNVALQVFQNSEITTGHVGHFTFSPKFQ